MMGNFHVLEDIEPKGVFYFFEEISKIPRGSGNTDKISNYLVDFAKNRNLKFYKDDLNNVIIYKEGTFGFENKDSLILQGHMDIVCDKKLDSSKNMELEGIDLEINGDYISGIDTSLGGDNGIAIAMILGILDSNNLIHPPIEAVFTSDEEIGLIGANYLDISKLSGKYLINLDSEEEGVMVVSCAGGNRINLEIPINRLEYNNFQNRSYNKINLKGDVGEFLINISISGLKGGHSGIEINKGLANANKLLAKLLKNIKEENISFNIFDIYGGNLDNAIANNSNSTILSPNFDEIKKIAKDFEVKINQEFKDIEDKIKINLDLVEFSKISVLSEESTNNIVEISVLSEESTNNIVDFINELPNGVCKISDDIEDFVESSLNLGIMNLNEDKFNLVFSVRSSFDSRREKINNKLISITNKYCGDFKIIGEYPGWELKEESKLQEIILKEYKKEYSKDMKVNAIHAGLECGIFVNKIPNLDAVSIGPNLFDVHTYNEKLSISSVDRTYKLLLNVLKQF